MGISWGYHGDIMGNIMGNIMGIMWKIYAGKYGDVDGKSWGKSQIPDEFDGYIMVNIVGTQW